MKSFSRYPLTLVALVFTAPFVLPVAAQPTSGGRDERVEALIQEMTLEEKVGEMTQLTLQAVSSVMGSDTTEHQIDPAKLEAAVVGHHVGSILNVWDAAFTPAHWAEVITAIQDAAQRRGTGIPVLYGIDAVHGHHYMQGATIFPQNIALAATFDPELAREAGRVTAVEMRASGIPWNFAPVLDMGRQPLWSRFFETFGEDVHLVSAMGLAAVEGLQGDDIGAPGFVAACGKHFLGYSLPLSGRDRTPAWIPEHYLREYFLPSFRTAIEQGNLRTLMVNSGEINGVPVHADPALLTRLLRDELGFDGVVVTDWADVQKLVDHHHVASDRREATKLAVLAGIDMAMVPYDFSFYDDLLALVQAGEIPESRLDESVRRILQLKMDLGLFDDPYPDADLVASIGSAEHQAVSRQAAEEAITLLENDGTLPLQRNTRLLVTGPGADDLPMMYGSWTYTWQGTNRGMYPESAHSVLDALRAEAGADHVAFVPGASLSAVLDVDAAAEAARDADVAVVVIGEGPSTEQPGDIEDLTLSAAQMQLAQAVMATGTPTVLVLLENRPRIVRDLVDGAAAVVLAYESGPYTGEALADILYGDVNPSGRLPFTYPRYANGLVPYDHKQSEENGPHGFNPQWPFGHGRSYTTFAYANLRVQNATVQSGGDVVISVDVANTGGRDGEEVVLAYIRDEVASITPPVRRLRAFEKIALAAGQQRSVSFTIPASDLAFIGIDNRPVLEPGTFEVQIGDQQARFEVTSGGTH